MSLYIGLAILGYAFLALVTILDKFILSKDHWPPSVFAFMSGIITLPILLLIPFGVNFLATPLHWVVALVSGVCFALALWALYIGYEKSEISHLGPFVGAVIPFIVLVLGQLFLTEKISSRELVAIFILIIGALLISFEKSKLNKGWHGGVFWGFLASVFFAASHVATKFIYNHYDFFSGLVLTRSIAALAGVLLIFHPVVIKFVKDTFHPNLIEKTKAKIKINRSRQQTIVVFANKFLALVSILILQYAIAIGSVTIVNALHGVQYGILVLLVAFLSKFHPKLFKEDYAKKEFAQELLAVIIISVGLMLLLT